MLGISMDRVSVFAVKKKLMKLNLCTLDSGQSLEPLELETFFDFESVLRYF